MRMWRKGNSCMLWWECKLVRPLWKTVCGFLRKPKLELSYDPAIPLLGIYLQKTKTLNSKRYMHPNVHSNTTDNSQVMEETLLPINKSMDNKDVMYIQTHTYIHMYIHTQWTITQPQKINFAIFCNMDGLGRHYAK